MQNVDIVIVGAGITGLWLLNRLHQTGYNVLLLEKDGIGSGQTLQSQGILHGGTKYALKGKQTHAAKALSDMPALWQACLNGAGEIDLTSVKILSHHHYLFSSGQFFGHLKNLVSSHALTHGRILKNKADFPTFFQNPAFKGSVSAIDETVLDVPSLMLALTKPVMTRIIKTNDHTQFYPDSRGGLSHIDIQHNGQTHSIKPKRTILAAGEGNEAILSAFNNPPQMQRRPLHQVSIQFPKNTPSLELFAHCIGKGTKPLFTITTHAAENGNTIWYVGGEIAEQGIENNSETQVKSTITQLKKHLPWVDFSGVTGTSFMINRAENKEPKGKKPNSFYVSTMANMIATWPTKLVLVPALAKTIINTLATDLGKNAATQKIIQPLTNYPIAPIATPKWSSLTCKKDNSDNLISG